jgi:hypothetical protein
MNDFVFTNFPLRKGFRLYLELPNKNVMFRNIEVKLIGAEICGIHITWEYVSSYLIPGHLFVSIYIHGFPENIR